VIRILCPQYSFESKKDTGPPENCLMPYTPFTACPVKEVHTIIQFLRAPVSFLYPVSSGQQITVRDPF
jgi:hypothetical protein